MPPETSIVAQSIHRPARPDAHAIPNPTLVSDGHQTTQTSATRHPKLVPRQWPTKLNLASAVPQPTTASPPSSRYPPLPRLNPQANAPSTADNAPRRSGSKRPCRPAQRQFTDSARETYRMRRVQRSRHLGSNASWAWCGASSSRIKAALRATTSPSVRPPSFPTYLPT